MIFVNLSRRLKLLPDDFFFGKAASSMKSSSRRSLLYSPVPRETTHWRGVSRPQRCLDSCTATAQGLLVRMPPSCREGRKKKASFGSSQERAPINQRKQTILDDTSGTKTTTLIRLGIPAAIPVFRESPLPISPLVCCPEDYNCRTTSNDTNIGICFMEARVISQY